MKIIFVEPRFCLNSSIFPSTGADEGYGSADDNETEQG